jgi:hypothetical protein
MTAHWDFDLHSSDYYWCEYFFSYTYYLFVCLPLRAVCLGLLPIFNYIFIIETVEFFIFSILTLCQIYNFKYFLPSIGYHSEFFFSFCGIGTWTPISEESYQGFSKHLPGFENTSYLKWIENYFLIYQHIVVIQYLHLCLQCILVRFTSFIGLLLPILEKFQQISFLYFHMWIQNTSTIFTFIHPFLIPTPLPLVLIPRKKTLFYSLVLHLNKKCILIVQAGFVLALQAYMNCALLKLMPITYLFTITMLPNIQQLIVTLDSYITKAILFSLSQYVIMYI